MRVSAILLVSVLLFAWCAAVVATALPDAGPVPSASLSLEPSQVEANVTQRQPGEAHLIGTLEIDQPVHLTSNVTLNSIVQTGWRSELTPNVTEVTGPGTVHFTVDVTVPAATSCFVNGQVQVRATVKAPLLAAVEATANAIVTVDQYYEVRVMPEDPFLLLKRGESGHTALEIYNEGNGNDIFTISLVNVPNGVQARLDQSTIALMPDENGTVMLDVTVEDDSPDVSHKVVVQVTSSESGGDCEKTCHVTVSVWTLSDELKAPGPPIPLVLLAFVVMAALLRRRAKGGQSIIRTTK